MLILSRRKEERVVVELPEGGTGTVTVISLGRGRVKIGFDFPDPYRIHRNESTSQPKAA